MLGAGRTQLIRVQNGLMLPMFMVVAEGADSKIATREAALAQRLEAQEKTAVLLKKEISSAREPLSVLQASVAELQRVTAETSSQISQTKVGSEPVSLADFAHSVPASTFSPNQIGICFMQGSKSLSFNVGSTENHASSPYLFRTCWSAHKRSVVAHGVEAH